MLWQIAIILFQQPEDFTVLVFHSLVTGPAGNHIDPVIRPYLFYKAFKLIPGFDNTKNLIEMKNTGMFVIDDDKIPDIGTPVNDEVHDIHLFNGERVVAQELINLFSR